MKNEINSIASTAYKKDEVTIFRAMETSLKKFTQAVFVEETHGRPGFVEYSSNNSPVPVVKEIADLLLVCYSVKTKTTRICFLQAKFHRPRRLTSFLRFKGDFYQWELLNSRPMIKSLGGLNFPIDILSFSNYKTISSFGIFFYDNQDKLEMLFTIPDLLTPRTVKTHKNRPCTTLIFPGNQKCPCYNCVTLGNNEVQTTCSLDMFEKQLLNGLIGAPVNGTRIEGFLETLVQSSFSVSKDPLLSEILHTLKGTTQDQPIESDSYLPNILFVKANGDQT